MTFRMQQLMNVQVRIWRRGKESKVRVKFADTRRSVMKLTTSDFSSRRAAVTAFQKLGYRQSEVLLPAAQTCSRGAVWAPTPRR